MTPSDPAATLEEIRQNHAEAEAARGLFDLSDRAGVFYSSAMDVPRLVAAVDAVLKLHQPGPVVILGALCRRHENHRHFSITRTEADDVRACPDCTATVYTSCTGCNPQVSVDTCPDRLAITDALKGETDA